MEDRKRVIKRTNQVKENILSILSVLELDQLEGVNRILINLIVFYDTVLKFQKNMEHQSLCQLEKKEFRN